MMIYQWSSGIRGALDYVSRQLFQQKRTRGSGIAWPLPRFRTEESMKRGLSVFLLSALIMGTLVFVAPSFDSGQAFAQTTVRVRRHKRTFWQKHRDKLTLAGTTAAGAGIGAAAGGG